MKRLIPARLRRESRAIARTVSHGRRIALWPHRMATTYVAHYGTKVVGKTALHLTAIVVALSIGSAMPAAAQSSPQDSSGRAQELSSERDTKAQRLEAPKRSLIERALTWYDNNEARLQWRAIHFSGGSFPQGAGFGYGIGIKEDAMGSPVVDEHQANRIDGAMFAARTIRGYQRISARMDVRNISGKPLDAIVRWQDYELPQEDFYGLGGSTTTAQRTNYRLDGNEFGAGLSWRPTQALSIGADVSHLTPVIGAGTDPLYASIEARFTESEAPGLTDLPRFMRGDARIGLDWRDSETHPRRGGQYQATLSQFSGIDDASFDFRRLDVSVQQILPLPNRYRRIELRAAAALTDAIGDSQVPFIYQPTLGGVSTLRGYPGSRFRDQNAVWASAEYQWEAWWALDGAFFIDAGQVASDRSDFRIREFDVTYGFGFRLHGNENFIARLDLAYGREGFHPILGFKYGF
jgi:hypothetical protein